MWVRWTYLGVHMQTGEAAYRGTEDFFAYPNWLIVRRQTYETLRSGDPHGYTREPVEMIAMSPVGKLWSDVLAGDAVTGESLALAVLDIFSERRYDVFWKRKTGAAVWSGTARRSGASWGQLDDAKGVALVVPMRDGSPFLHLRGRVRLPPRFYAPEGAQPQKTPEASDGCRVPGTIGLSAA